MVNELVDMVSRWWMVCGVGLGWMMAERGKLGDDDFFCVFGLMSESGHCLDFGWGR